jgi:hypothetical protein
MSNVKPITPKEVVKEKLLSIPDEVIEAFNELIAKNWDGYRAGMKQDDIVALIKQKMSLKKDDTIFERHWLDVEDIYRKVGWIVEYDKPAYNESYDATFEFRKKK